jgi:hypothetical protein
MTKELPLSALVTISSYFPVFVLWFLIHCEIVGEVFCLCFIVVDIVVQCFVLLDTSVGRDAVWVEV